MKRYGEIVAEMNRLSKATQDNPGHALKEVWIAAYRTLRWTLDEHLQSPSEVWKS